VSRGQVGVGTTNVHDGGMPTGKAPSKRTVRASRPPEASRGRASANDYYFSEGRRIHLKRNRDMVGVLLNHPAVTSSRLRASLKRAGRPLREGVVIVPWSAIPDGRREFLEGDGALLPVYEQDGALVVVLPEVRVEGTDPGQVPAIKAWLDATEHDAELVEERGTRVTLRPRSGRAADALRIANEVGEQVRPALSQARFLRVVPER
jgi:hypothetical protein